LDERDELLIRYLSGHASQADGGQVAKLLPKQKVTIFVSSTFTDTHKERNILHENILPRLRSQVYALSAAGDANIQVIFYDMRFGVKDENTRDHMTWIACKEAIEQCYHESDGLFFLSLQGDKYGYSPLPKFLDQKLLDGLLESKENPHLTPELTNLIKEWYRFDENEVSPRYEIKNLSAENSAKYWSEVLPTIKHTLLDEVPFELTDDLNFSLLINHSITEWESLYALSLEKERCFWLRRRFDFALLQEYFQKCPEKASLLTDTLHSINHETTVIKPVQHKLEKLLVVMEKQLSSSPQLPVGSMQNQVPISNHSEGNAKIKDVAINLSPLQYEEDNGTGSYLSNWESTVSSYLSQELENVHYRNKEWKNYIMDLSRVHTDYSHVEEIFHHLLFTEKKSKHFYGREEIVSHGIETISQFVNQEYVPTIPKAPSEKKGNETQTRRLNRERLDEDDDFSTTTSTMKTKKSSTSKGSGKKSTSNPLHGVALAVIGKSGSGKTALMSKLATSFAENPTYADIPILIRYCGTSRYSLHAINLIQNICVHILSIYSNLRTVSLPNAENDEEKGDPLEEFLSNMSSYDFGKSVTVFHQLIHDYPVMLFIDSLDQLSNRNEARSQLSFLKGIDPHPQSRIIVSTLPDEFNESRKEWKYLYLCEKRLTENNVSALYISSSQSLESGKSVSSSWLAKGAKLLKSSKKEEEVDINNSRHILEQLLRLRNRTLTSAQWNTVTEAVKVEPTILYMKLAVEEIRKWRSYETENHISPTVKGVINQLFTDLEKDYGHHFVSYAFAFITYAREGISDIEMKDCLLMQPEVMKEVYQYCSNISDFPIHVWLRLKASIKHLIVEKENHCIQWFHRQLKETAFERYHKMKRNAHEIMGIYFSNGFTTLADLKDFRDERGKHDKTLHVNASEANLRHLQSQPLTFTEVPVWFPSCQLNIRRIQESICQLILAEFPLKAMKELCNIELICGSCLIGEGISFVSYVKALYGHFAYQNDPVTPEIDLLYSRARHYYRWLMKYMSSIVISSNPRQRLIGTAVAEPLISEVRKDILRILWNSDEHSRFVPRSICTIAGNDSSLQGADTNNYLMREFTLNGAIDFDNHLMSLSSNQTHTYELTVAYSPDNKKIASGSDKGVIQIWDASIGEVLNTLEKSRTHVKCLVWYPDCIRLVAGCSNNEIHIWDTITGSLIHSFEAHTRLGVFALCFSKNGKRFASGGGHADEKIKIWDANSFLLIKEIEIPKVDYIQVLGFHPLDDQTIACGGNDKLVHIFDITTCSALQSCKGHTAYVIDLKWTKDGKSIAACDLDGTIKLWSSETGQLLHHYQDRQDSDNRFFQFVAFNPEETLLCGVTDHCLKIWKVRERDRLLYEFSIDSRTNGKFNFLSWDEQKGLQLVSCSNGYSTLSIYDTSKIMKTVANLFNPASFPASSSLSALQVKAEPMQEIQFVCCDPKGEKVAIGSDRWKLQIWDLQTGFHLKTFHNEPEQYMTITGLEWHPTSSDHILYSSTNKKIKLLNIQTGQTEKVLSHHTDKVNCFVISADAKNILSGSKDHTIRMVAIASNFTILTISVEEQFSVDCVGWNTVKNYNQIVAGLNARYSNIIQLWDISDKLNPVKQRSFDVSYVNISTVKFHPTKENYLLVGLSHSMQARGFGDIIKNEETIKIWDLQTGDVLSEFTEQKASKYSVSFHPFLENILLSIGKEGSVKLYDIYRKKTLKRLEGNGDKMQAISWNHDGTKILAGTGLKTLKLRDEIELIE
jgi:WD40 repeat protein